MADVNGIKIGSWKSQVADIARPNRFWTTISQGTAGGTWQEQNMAFLTKSAQLPGRTIGEVEVNWQGMKVKLSGDPTYETMDLTFLNDYAWNIKNYIEKWLEEVATADTNFRTAHATYKCEIKLEQLGRQGEVLKTYILEGAFPTAMQAIELSMESNDTLEELSVTFTYDKWRVE